MCVSVCECDCECVCECVCDCVCVSVCVELYLRYLTWNRETGNNSYNNNNNYYYYLLQLGCHPVAVVILHVYRIGNWLLINLSREGYMRSM